MRINKTLWFRFPWKNITQACFANQSCFCKLFCFFRVLSVTSLQILQFHVRLIVISRVLVVFPAHLSIKIYFGWVSGERWALMEQIVVGIYWTTSSSKHLAIVHVQHSLLLCGSHWVIRRRMVMRNTWLVPRTITFMSFLAKILLMLSVVMRRLLKPRNNVEIVTRQK